MMVLAAGANSTEVHCLMLIKNPNLYIGEGINGITLIATFRQWYLDQQQTMSTPPYPQVYYTQ